MCRNDIHCQVPFGRILEVEAGRLHFDGTPGAYADHVAEQMHAVYDSHHHDDDNDGDPGDSGDIARAIMFYGGIAAVVVIITKGRGRADSITDRLSLGSDHHHVPR